MSIIKYIFTPNYIKYEGVRPINIYLLRLLYFLMFVGVGLQTWATIIKHQGPWDYTRAVAFCVWAAYPTLSIFGLIRPLRWLPIVIFMIFYKTLWVIAVAYPLWRAGSRITSCGRKRSWHLKLPSMKYVSSAVPRAATALLALGHSQTRIAERASACFVRLL